MSAKPSGEPPRPNRRGIIKKAADWAAGGLIGQIAVEIFSKAAVQVSHTVDDVSTDVLEQMIGTTLEMPVWNGDRMYKIECDFDRDKAGYILTGKKVICYYKEGEECARLGQDMVKMGLLFMKERGIRLRVNFKEIKRGLG